MTSSVSARKAIVRLIDVLYEYRGRELDPRSGVRSGGVPESIETAGEDLSVIISGEEFRRFRQALRALRAIDETEHLSEKELDSLLWELTCRVVLQPKPYRGTKMRVAAAQEVLDAAMKPWSVYEVATNIENLDLRTMRHINVIDATFVRWTAAQSLEWNVSRPTSRTASRSMPSQW